jgi:cyclopropane fatty-acyl-phospholipid synthase-like methyltransferase
MKYYEMHDDAYKSLQSSGYVSWDRERNAKDLFEHDINVALKLNLSTYFPSPCGKKSLDLGTGTGTVALFLSKEGFDSTGYDISETAISMASKNTSKLKLKAEFIVKDINKDVGRDCFDLIVDSSFLHCIVLDEDRSNCYNFVRNNLAEDGLFFIHTMIKSNDMSEMLSRDHLILEDETLWSTGKDSWDMDWKEVQGQRVFPHRRIMSVYNLEKEIRCNGFDIVDSSTKDNGENPLTYTAWLINK